jgi:hypothetical protein
MTIIYTPQQTGLSFGDLVERVKAFGYGDEDEPFIKTWINMAYQDIATRKRWSWTEAIQDVLTAPGQETTPFSALSETPAFFGRLKPSTTGLYVPEYQDNMAFEENFTKHPTIQTGQPTRYTIWSGLLRWFPIPDDVYQYQMQYWAIPFELVNNSDYPLIPPQYRNVLVVGALMHAADRDHNPQLYAQRIQYYESLIRQMFGHDWAKDGSTRRRAAMPATYGGMYD